MHKKSTKAGVKQTNLSLERPCRRSQQFCGKPNSKLVHILEDSFICEAGLIRPDLLPQSMANSECSDVRESPVFIHSFLYSLIQSMHSSLNILGFGMPKSKDEDPRLCFQTALVYEWSRSRMLGLLPSCRQSDGPRKLGPSTCLLIRLPRCPLISHYSALRSLGSSRIAPPTPTPFLAIA